MYTMRVRRMLMPWENDENGHKSILHTEIFRGVHARESEWVGVGEMGQLLGRLPAMLRRKLQATWVINDGSPMHF